VDINHLMFAAAVIMGATIIAVGVAKKLELGSIVALLAVGMALGPHSPIPLLTGHVSEMQAIGEIGVTLLVFAVGLDLQPTQVWSIRRLVFGLGAAQYVLTTLAIMAFLALTVGIAHVKWQSVLVVGLGLAISSAAIPFPILQERGETATIQGRAVLAIDIFQGFMIVPILALIPILAVGSTHGGDFLDLKKTLEVGGALVGVFVLGRYVLPRLLTLTARDLGPSGFAVIVLAAVFFAGWWMEAVGISMALGAFMIGVLLSTTVYAEQVKAAVTPAKQVLLAIFFIAIGMAIDVRQLLDFKGDLLLYVPSLLSIKFVVLFFLARAFRLALRPAILTALLMMPFDEIAYVIFASANANGLLGAREYVVGLSVISLSFVVSPVLINFGYKLCQRLEHARPADAPQEPFSAAEGFVVVADYGYAGRTICTMLEQAQIPYTALELDPDLLAMAKKWKHNVQYGDAANPAMVQAIANTHPRLIIATNGANDTPRRMIDHLRRFYPQVPIIVAVPYLFQRDGLRKAGVGDVVALAPEGVLSFGRRILDRLGIAATKSDAIVHALEANDYLALRVLAGSEDERTDAPATANNSREAARS
jgi:glutathione-regulated potassium-efflux system protein KefB